MARGIQYHTDQTHFMRKDLKWNEITSGSAVNIDYLPAGAVVVGASAVVVTAFNSATSDVLDIGTSGDGDGFATDLDISAVGLKAADELATSNDLYASTATLLTATWTGAGTAPTAGHVVVIVEFMPDNTHTT